MRLLCGLRQFDVSAATGVSITVLSAAERGQKSLGHSEQALVVDFLNRRWSALQDFEVSNLTPNNSDTKQEDIPLLVGVFQSGRR